MAKKSPPAQIAPAAPRGADYFVQGGCTAGPAAGWSMFAPSSAPVGRRRESMGRAFSGRGGGVVRHGLRAP